MASKAQKWGTKYDPDRVLGREPEPDPITRVIFRKWRHRPQTIIAVFPDVPADHRGSFACYEHIGQHGACDRNIIGRTLPAYPHEYDALKRELEGEPYGYQFQVLERWPRS